MEKLYLVFYFLLWISIAFCISDLDDIQNACKARCQSNLIQSVGESLFCDEDCWVLQCQNGCTKVSPALSSNCQRACTSSTTQKQNCIQGCNLALDIYANKIKGQLEPLLKPDLIRETKNYSSIVLQWNGKILPDITYMIQIRMLDIHQISSDWQIHNDSQFLANGAIAIFNLHPYVTYRFKVLAVITPLPQHVAESPETVPITTLPHGVPASAPKITSISAPSPSVISISWTPPQFSNGPLVGYRINVNPQNHPTLKPSTKDLLGGATSWTVGQLQPSQHYVITVSAWNAAGEGPADSSTITTPNPGNCKFVWLCMSTVPS
ncbi:proto-oncogene tyrosine-protein kinase ROS-like isoform X2 [Gigantopelta aegis]|uniref:proto-oncogene tyrosine-protein kinase ROS-like isoform X2 n=1 Tax=Gigantopelta aegis TaxID=1735272 RepID=UPI001B88E389|nr:proto-oncogene tyrosine-protein kinase ROS-like isoform X2 [Gigantopelta aegis]